MFIFSNLATSLDGKIGTSERSLLPLGTPDDRKHMIFLRNRSDAVLIGASTLRTLKKPCLASNRNRPINLVLSSALEGFSPRWSFFTEPDLRRVLFVTRKLSASTLKSFSRFSEIVQLKANKASAADQIVKYLEKIGCRNLLIEGGGGVMWEFASQNLIDEYHVTLTPKIIGGIQSPTLVDGKGLASNKILPLKLKQCRIHGDELYLTYARDTRKKAQKR